MTASRRPDERPPGALPVESGVPARDPFVRRLATTVGVVALAGILVAVLVLAVDIFLAAFGGILFAVLLRAGANLLVRYTPVPEGWGYTALLLLIAALLVVGGLLLAPLVQEQVERATEQVPVIVERVEAYLQQRDWGRQVLERVQGGEEGDGIAEDAIGATGDVLGAFTDWFYYFLTAFFVGLFAAAKPRLYVEGTAALFPLRKRERVLELFEELGFTLRWWLAGQAVAMILIGVSTWLVLWAFDVPLAIPLGVVVGLLGFIPYIGPIIGLVPVAIVAGTQGVDILFYVVGAYSLVQLVEGYVITPLIQHRMVYLPPVFTIITQIVLGTLLGVLGFILATPLAAVILVLSRFYREDVLGEPGVVEARGEG
jgi:predicted PurR-regulated permease PerM